MDLDLSRLAGLQAWPDPFDHAVAALADGAIEPLLAELIDGHVSAEIVRILADTSAIPRLSAELATSPAGHALAQLLTNAGPRRRSFEVLADSRAVADIGHLLTEPNGGTGPEGAPAGPTDVPSNEAGPQAWRSLAWTLVGSRAVRSQAKAILSTPEGSAGVAGALGDASGRRLARSLGHDDSGLLLVRYLVNSPAAKQLALTLTSPRGDRSLARSLAERDAAVELAETIVRTADGHRLAWDLANNGAGRTFALALTDTLRGRQLLEQLADDQAGRRLAAAIVEGDAEDGLFTDHPGDEVAILRLVAVVALVLMGLIEPQALAVLTLVAAAAVATPSIGAPDAGRPGTAVAGGQRHRITVDVGPSSTMTELSEILADLDILTTLSVRLAITERQLDGPGAAEPDGAVRTWQPVVTAVPTDGHTVERVRYQNPLDVIIASGTALTALAGLTGGLTALVGLVQRWRLDGQQSEAELRKTAAEADKATAEARKANAEAANVELDLYRRLIEVGAESGTRLSPETAGTIIGGHPGGVAALERLSRYDIAVETLTGPDGQREAWTGVP